MIQRKFFRMEDLSCFGNKIKLHVYFRREKKERLGEGTTCLYVAAIA